MFERLADPMRQVMVLADAEARMLNHHYIGTEHVLLALTQEGGGLAARALESLGVTADTARRKVEELVGRGQHESPGGHIPITPGTKKTLELARPAAIALGGHSVGTEHILLGLIRNGEDNGRSPAIQVLSALGADPDEVRRRVTELVSAIQGSDETETG